MHPLAPAPHIPHERERIIFADIARLLTAPPDIAGTRHNARRGDALMGDYGMPPERGAAYERPDLLVGKRMQQIVFSVCRATQAEVTAPGR